MRAPRGGLTSPAPLRYCVRDPCGVVRRLHELAAQAAPPGAARKLAQVTTCACVRFVCVYVMCVCARSWSSRSVNLRGSGGGLGLQARVHLLAAAERQGPPREWLSATTQRVLHGVPTSKGAHPRPGGCEGQMRATCACARKRVLCGWLRGPRMAQPCRCARSRRTRASASV